ncbi:MAG TPA: hypothetical protein VHB79_09690 [Polyangiaceae bacterium]|nr:hypothetical protein [Polyangiaceae bacterium]
MDHLDFLDICAILLGISFTIAKLDAQGRKAESFPHVAPADFEAWRLWTVSIYRLGLSACFLRVLFHQGWVLYMARYPATGPSYSKSQIALPMLLDALFLGVVTSTFFRGSRARARRRELGIVLAPLSPQQQAALAPETEEERKSTSED